VEPSEDFQRFFIQEYGVVFDDDKPYNTEWPERSTP